MSRINSFAEEVINNDPIFPIIFHLSANCSACSQKLWHCTTRATMRVPSLCLKRLWWSTIKKMWSAGPCAKDRRGLRATITSATVTASMNSCQVRTQNWASLCQQETASDMHLSSSNIEPVFSIESEVTKYSNKIPAWTWFYRLTPCLHVTSTSTLQSWIDVDMMPGTN